MSATATANTQVSVEELEGRNWESVIDRLTRDMDPWSVDILRLADRYKTYLHQMDELDLEIPARLLVVCAALLRVKVELMQGQDDEQHEPQEEPIDEQQMMEDSWEDDIEIPSRTLEPPVTNKPQRRVSLSELKDALEKAVNIQEQRKKRQSRRQNETFLEIEEDDITDKLETLMDRLADMFSTSNQVPFTNVLEQNNREEKIEKFTHILHLETDDKIRCEQEQFFGDIRIYPGDELD